MKRPSIDNKYEISNYYSFFFWRRCLFCQKEFRREKGKRFYLSRTGNMLFWSYSCKECSVDSVEGMNNLIESWFKKSRPKPPRGL